MKIYDKAWQEISRNDWPEQGEIFVCKDPQKRCWPESWTVSIFWDPESCQSKWIEMDIVEQGIFWTKENAILFAETLVQYNIGKDYIH
jgi:hypothetical protein